MNNIYQDIAERTNGDIYIGVVGPVRVGKSTFITQFMNKLVVPNITEKNAKERTIDELPQSADGKTIMTTEPKFVPSNGAEVSKIASSRLMLPPFNTFCFNSSTICILCTSYILARAGFNLLASPAARKHRQMSPGTASKKQ